MTDWRYPASIVACQLIVALACAFMANGKESYRGSVRRACDNLQAISNVCFTLSVPFMCWTAVTIIWSIR